MKYGSVIRGFFFSLFWISPEMRQIIKFQDYFLDLLKKYRHKGRRVLLVWSILFCLVGCSKIKLTGTWIVATVLCGQATSLQVGLQFVTKAHALHAKVLRCHLGFPKIAWNLGPALLIKIRIKLDGSAVYFSMTRDITKTVL